MLAVWAAIAAIVVLQISFSERPDEWRIALVDWAPWIVAAPLVIWCSGKWPIEQKSWRWAVPVHLLMSFAVTLALGTVAAQAMLLRFGSDRPLRDFLLARPASPGEFTPPPPGAAGRGLSESRNLRMERRRFPPGRATLLLMVLTRGRSSLLFYWALLAMTQAVTYHRRSVERERRALAAEARLAEARLIALQAQLQPHFLFNTLNAISAMVYDKPAAADEMICSLSDLLRRVLAASARAEVSLTDEVAMARSYVAIQRMRFSEMLEVQWDVPPDLARAAVPTLLLQPLVENAVVHAVERQTRKCRVSVSASRQGSRLAVLVVNSGPENANVPGARDKAGLGIGLSNTQARLKELYGADHVFNFSLDANGAASVRIEIPYREIGNQNESPDRR